MGPVSTNKNFTRVKAELLLALKLIEGDPSGNLVPQWSLLGKFEAKNSCQIFFFISSSSKPVQHQTPASNPVAFIGFCFGSANNCCPF